MMLGVVREITPGQRRVTLIPTAIPGLLGLGAKVVVESGTGQGPLPDELWWTTNDDDDGGRWHIGNVGVL
jgi:alanine dehydrogenase